MGSGTGRTPHVLYSSHVLALSWRVSRERGVMLPAGYFYSTRARKGSDVFAAPGLTAPIAACLLYPSASENL